MTEVRWFWHHWKTWSFEHVAYREGGGIYVFYFGCLCIARHYLENLTGQPIHQKDATQRTKRNDGKDHARLAAVAYMPCCICSEWGLPQSSPTQVHHCIMGRYGTRKSPDIMTIPLCEGHHQGNFDTSKIALHRSPKEWAEQYGKDTDWISWTEERL